MALEAIESLTRRQNEILNLVRDRGYVSLDMLADYFDVSQQTVRRDVIFLSKNGYVERHHGGAGLPAGTDRLAYTRRQVRKADEKEVIAGLIAKQIPDGASVFIDIGTTMEAVAAKLIHHKNLKIITNHIGVVSLFCEATDFEIILTGGLVRNRDRAITGEETVAFLKKFRVGYGIFGAGGLTEDGQLLDYHYRDAQASRAAMEIAKVKFVGIDHSKFGADAMMPFADVSEINGIFSDKKPSAKICAALKASDTTLYTP